MDLGFFGEGSAAEERERFFEADHGEEAARGEGTGEEELEGVGSHVDRSDEALRRRIHRRRGGGGQRRREKSAGSLVKKKIVFFGVLV